MDIRLGFSRLARVAAIAYVIAALCMLIATAKSMWDQRQERLSAAVFSVYAPSGRVLVLRARDSSEALEEARNFDMANPTIDPRERPSEDVKKWSDEQLFAKLDGNYVVADGGQVEPEARAIGTFSSPPQKRTRTLTQKPTRVRMERYDEHRGLDELVLSVASQAGWLVLVYAALWGVFRAVRWVALGFMGIRQ